ncbi:MAG: transposase [Iphinoe sp. HA4291-MV1]|nr:transposase [Iphinoe sp. HA4291-MV1]
MSELKTVVCPYCGSIQNKRWGLSKSGVQRYKCKECDRSFTGASTGRPHSFENVCKRCRGICKRNGLRDGRIQKWLCIEPGCGYAWEEND